MNDVRTEIETSMNAEEKKEVPKKEEEKAAVDAGADVTAPSPEYKAPERKVFGQEEEKK
jgi:hypothetical protein